MGIVHGFCILFSLIGSIFTDFRIYAFPNSGGWYDFGYFIGAAMFLGTGGASRDNLADRYGWETLYLFFLLTTKFSFATINTAMYLYQHRRIYNEL